MLTIGASKKAINEPTDTRRRTFHRRSMPFLSSRSPQATCLNRSQEPVTAPAMSDANRSLERLGRASARLLRRLTKRSGRAQKRASRRSEVARIADRSTAGVVSLGRRRLGHTPSRPEHKRLDHRARGVGATRCSAGVRRPAGRRPRSDASARVRRGTDDPSIASPGPNSYLFCVAKNAFSHLDGAARSGPPA